jgi:hypothetical protein
MQVHLEDTNHGALLVLGVFIRGKRQRLLEHPFGVYHSLDLSASLSTSNDFSRSLDFSTSIIGQFECVNGQCCRLLRNEHVKPRPSNVFFATLRTGSTRADEKTCRRPVIGE